MRGKTADKWAEKNTEHKTSFHRPFYQRRALTACQRHRLLAASRALGLLLTASSSQRVSRCRSGTLNSALEWSGFRPAPAAGVANKRTRALPAARLSERATPHAKVRRSAQLSEGTLRAVESHSASEVSPAVSDTRCRVFLFWESLPRRCTAAKPTANRNVLHGRSPRPWYPIVAQSA